MRVRDVPAYCVFYSNYDGDLSSSVLYKRANGDIFSGNSPKKVKLPLDLFVGMHYSDLRRSVKAVAKNEKNA